ncbi:MAG: peptidyl-prolyl cis-trans isomerase cyclophilin type, partial [Solirubrobacterales bacterium]|nr:peptidyl-prolyl cis-trans isomerase cyclophilin type [Solirubrobacterales bacterium]
ASFAFLARRRFYDGLTFHRVAAGFVIQGGDPVGNGTGGPGYSVVEPPPRSIRYLRGTVAMAKAPNEPSGASGSQFFVVTAANASNLTSDYALVGRVVSGQDVVQRIGGEPTSPPGDGAPVQPVVIDSIRIR